MLFLAGQVLNSEKSFVIFSPNTTRRMINQLAYTLGANTSNKLSKYLGVFIDKVEAKLTGWKSKLLSQAARLTLIKSVIQSSPLYRLSILDKPGKYTNHLESICTNFYWGYKEAKPAMHLLLEKKSYLKKQKGGLGLRQTALFNKALLAKQVWEIVDKPHSIYMEIRIGSGELAQVGSKFWWSSSALHHVISLCNHPDKLVWKFSSNGEYKVSSGYSLVLPTDQFIFSSISGEEGSSSS
ncbi:reverse transcriptase [Senna tora]|uniref:Reverse transcriptase n=1 Tax=Senna tora TaxID=362788 RepID=A0A834W4H6_9FABA|nr:reverse transcriptase [Senna tora]